MPAADPFDTRGFGAATDVGVSATIGPLSSMPGSRSIDSKGGSKQVADLAARDAIPGDALTKIDPNQFRQEGMTCYVAATGLTYQLQGGITNADWVNISAATAVGPKTRNTDTDAVLVGHILCQSPAVAQAVRLTDNAADDARSRPVGVATSAQPTPGSSVELQTNQGETAPVRMVTGLVPSLGEEIILSSVNGEGTIPGGTSAPVAGELVQRVGILLSTLTYDGAGDRLMLAQVDFSGTRRIES